MGKMPIPPNFYFAKLRLISDKAFIKSEPLFVKSEPLANICKIESGVIAKVLPLGFPYNILKA